MSRLSLLVIQPTPFCNISCDYCYLPDRDNRASMTLATLEQVLRNLFSSSIVTRDFTLVWHAGEPLVLPVAYYREAVALVARLKPPGIEVRHSIQTNGTLINEEWCEFFKAQNFRIGVSIDGPRHIHDAHRHTRAGRGSFDATMRGIETLLRTDQKFHVITVLTEQNIFAPDELFHFYDHAGIDSICFNVEESDGINRSPLMRRPDVRQEYREFLEAFIYLVRSRGKDWFVREFDNMRNSIFRPVEAEFENPQVSPFSIVAVDVRGKFTTFSPEFIGMNDPQFGDFVVGDLTTGPVEQALNHPIFLKLHREIAAGVAACEERCEYFSVCGGGAPANKLGETGSLRAAETAYCRCVTMGPADIILGDVDLQIARQERRSPYAPALLR